MCEIFDHLNVSEYSLIRGYFSFIFTSLTTAKNEKWMKNDENVEKRENMCKNNIADVCAVEIGWAARGNKTKLTRIYKINLL